MTTTTTAITILAVLVLFVPVPSLKIITQYEQGIVFRSGRLRLIYDPGLRLVVPFLERLVRADTRVVTPIIPPQEVVTGDNVLARVNAVVLFNVTDSVKAVVAMENYAIVTSQVTQTTLRSVPDRVGLDTVLAHHGALNADPRDTTEEPTEPWGAEISVVEIKGVKILEQMQRAMARGAEVERERCAKITSARGEPQASEELHQAVDTLSKPPASLQLRYLQTLLELSADQNSTVTFPLPMDIIGPLLERFSSQGSLPEANEGEGSEGAGAPRHR